MYYIYANLERGDSSHSQPTPRLEISNFVIWDSWDRMIENYNFPFKWKKLFTPFFRKVIFFY